ncbi:hypothetical protein CLAIMM_07671, partial [Cladophialophora immunda]
MAMSKHWSNDQEKTTPNLFTGQQVPRIRHSGAPPTCSMPETRYMGPWAQVIASPVRGVQSCFQDALLEGADLFHDQRSARESLDTDPIRDCKAPFLADPHQMEDKLTSKNFYRWTRFGWRKETLISHFIDLVNCRIVAANVVERLILSSNYLAL